MKKENVEKFIKENNETIKEVMKKENKIEEREKARKDYVKWMLENPEEQEYGW